MPEKIKIIGAGVSGLFLGCCLKKNNYHPTIYEKDISLSPYGCRGKFIEKCNITA